MGTSDVATGPNASDMRAFTRAVLDDIIALERLIQQGRIETGMRRIGAEQEMFLIDSSRQPAPVAVEVLQALEHDPRITTELARFNLEANLTPQEFGPECLRNMEWELGEILGLINAAAEQYGASVLLTGILPTLRVTNLTLDMMTPNPRYYELNRATSALRDGAFHIVMKGLDELDLTHDNVMFESANTSFQIHFQVGPEEFAPLYNVAQAISAPVLAAAVNSPILFGQRLWNETRVALFQRSVDVRSSAHRRRAAPPRVSFGDDWIHESILEIYRDDISRFRMLLSMPSPLEDPLQVVDDGGVPELRALRLHTGTVWRWNRACYGMRDGVPHLRIENRVLPSGPTVLDEVSNAAFFFGLMSSLSVEYPRIDQVFDFDDAKNNFFAAARHGLKAQFNWLGGRSYTAQDLVVNELLPHARQGLQRQGILEEDITRYLDTIEERVTSEQNGSVWILRSLSEMEGAPADVRLRSLTGAMHRNQKGGRPVHRWPLAELYRTRDWFPSYRTVGQFMSTELFTVRPQDPVDLAAKMMEWQHIRYVPVEDDHGRLAGLISYRSMLKLVDLRKQSDSSTAVVEEIMHRDPVTVGLDMPTLEAMDLMRREKVGCLCVVDDEGRLAGLVHIYDLLKVAQRVLEDFLREEDDGEADQGSGS